MKTIFNIENENAAVVKKNDEATGSVRSLLGLPVRTSPTAHRRSAALTSSFAQASSMLIRIAIGATLLGLNTLF